MSSYLTSLSGSALTLAIVFGLYAWHPNQLPTTRSDCLIISGTMVVLFIVIFIFQFIRSLNDRD